MPVAENAKSGSRPSTATEFIMHKLETATGFLGNTEVTVRSAPDAFSGDTECFFFGHQCNVH
jgi:hypothetical protein